MVQRAKNYKINEYLVLQLQIHRIADEKDLTLQNLQYLKTKKTIIVILRKILLY